MNNQHISTSSQASEAGPSAQSGQDTSQLDLLSVPPTPVPSSSDTGPTSKTMGMSEKSRQRRQDESTSSQPALPANPTPWLIETEATNQMTVSSGRNCAELLKTSDPAGLLVKKLLTSPRWQSMNFSLRWSPEGTPAGRLYFRLAASELDTSDKDYGLFYTPTCRDHKDTGNIQNVPENALLGRQYRHIFGQNLAPEFSEWLMGFPIGHTALPESKPLETP